MASSLLRWQGRTCGRPLLQDVCEEFSLLWICEPFAWCVPWLIGVLMCSGLQIANCILGAEGEREVFVWVSIAHRCTSSYVYSRNFPQNYYFYLLFRNFISDFALYNRWNTGNDTVAIIGKIPAMPTVQQATTAKTTTNNQTSYPSPYDGGWG